MQRVIIIWQYTPNIQTNSFFNVLGGIIQIFFAAQIVVFSRYVKPTKNLEI